MEPEDKIQKAADEILDLINSDDEGESSDPLNYWDNDDEDDEEDDYEDESDSW